MKGKELREAVKARMEEEYLQNPKLKTGKRITGYCILAWLLSRVLFLVVEMLCAKEGFVEFSPVNFASFVFSLLIAWPMINGTGKIAWLPLAGGIMMVFSIARNQMFSLLSIDQYPIIHLHILLYILTAVVTIASMLIILFHPTCKAYAERSTECMQELGGFPQRRL